MRFLALFAAGLALAACHPPPVSARSPALATPEALAGAWTLTVQGRARCELQLDVSPSAHGYRVWAERCEIPVAQWRPVPDGVELAAADGLTLILLQPAADGVFEGFDGERRAARLARPLAARG